jgi:hypothetical protein
MKFSAFNRSGEAKDYSVHDEWKKRASTGPQIELKKEFSTAGLPFDPNVRSHKIDEIPNSFIYGAFDGISPLKDPQSCYVSV